MNFIFLIGRLILGGYFLTNAYNHLKHTNSLVGYASSKGVRNPRFAVRGTGLLLLIGGLSLVTGIWPGIGIISLLLFLVPVSFKMHAYWKEADPTQQAIDRVNFMKNFALIGALLMLTHDAAYWPYVL